VVDIDLNISWRRRKRTELRGNHQSPIINEPCYASKTSVVRGHAARKAETTSIRAAQSNGDRRVKDPGRDLGPTSDRRDEKRFRNTW